MTTAIARGSLLALALTASACESAPTRAPAAPQAPAAHTASPAPNAPAAVQAGVLPQEGTQTDAQGHLLTNDPSAPADTPLCGTAARESNGISNAVYADGLRQDGVCASYACFDPLTATYIGMDGQRHVCR